MIIVVLVFRGRSLPLRDHYLEEKPMIGNGRINWADAVRCGAVVFVMVTKETKWIDAITVSLGVAIVLLSIVVLTGYAGQLSLASTRSPASALCRRSSGRGLRDPVPARTGGRRRRRCHSVSSSVSGGANQGINLAIVTLGLGTTIELMLFKNRNYTGGVQGTQVGNPTCSATSRVDQPPGPLRDLRAGLAILAVRSSPTCDGAAAAD